MDNESLFEEQHENEQFAQDGYLANLIPDDWNKADELYEKRLVKLNPDIAKMELYENVSSGMFTCPCCQSIFSTYIEWRTYPRVIEFTRLRGGG